MDRELQEKFGLSSHDHLISSLLQGERLKGLLHIYAKYNEAEKLDKCLQVVENINERTPDGKTPLDVAVHYQSNACIAILRKYNAAVTEWECNTSPAATDDDLMDDYSAGCALCPNGGLNNPQPWQHFPYRSSCEVCERPMFAVCECRLNKLEKELRSLILENEQMRLQINDLIYENRLLARTPTRDKHPPLTDIVVGLAYLPEQTQAKILILEQNAPIIKQHMRVNRVIRKMYAANVLSETHHQDLDSMATDYSKVDYLLALALQDPKYANSMRKALFETSQPTVAELVPEF